MATLPLGTYTQAIQNIPTSPGVPLGRFFGVGSLAPLLGLQRALLGLQTAVLGLAKPASGSASERAGGAAPVSLWLNLSPRAQASGPSHCIKY